MQGTASQAMTLVAPCLFGLESVVREQVEALGYRAAEVTDGRVSFSGGPDAVARANVGLRSAERVLIEVGRFGAETFDHLFEGTKAVDWAAFVRKDDAVTVTGASVRSALTSIPACQRIVKKAIADKLMQHYGLTRLPETGARLNVQFLLLKDTASVLLDTSGDPLYKRGYRTEHGEAPLRETLASALLHLSRYKGRAPFADPFCGSGTLSIEAALIATNRAPGMSRSFALEQLAFMPSDILKNARAEAAAAVTEAQCDIHAADIDPAMTALTVRNAERAGVASAVRVTAAPVSEFAPAAEKGVLVCNPPYGERTSERRLCEELYAQMGRVFASMTDWRTGILTSHPDFEKHYGRRASKKRKLYNGNLRCDYYQF